MSINDWLQQSVTHSADAQMNLRPPTTSTIVTTLSQDPYYQILQQPADLRLQLSVPAAGQPAMPKSLPTVLTQQSPYIELLIGPEGGLSVDECQQAAKAGLNLGKLVKNLTHRDCTRGGVGDSACFELLMLKCHMRNPNCCSIST